MAVTWGTASFFVYYMEICAFHLAHPELRSMRKNPVVRNWKPSSLRTTPNASR